jgi:DNA-binding transcriptional MerR regulator
MQTLLTSDVARTLQVSVDLVRYYERRGLLRASRSQGGVRLFDAAEVKRFQQERHSKTLRKLGVSSKSALAGVSKNQ